MLAVESKQTCEYRLLEVRDPAALTVVAPRRRPGEYSVEVGTDALYIVHNDGAPEFELAVAPFDATGTGAWRPPQRSGCGCWACRPTPTTRWSSAATPCR
ncbi:MAG: hypothetical protein R2719_12635 [Micropruina sp.]